MTNEINNDEEIGGNLTQVDITERRRNRLDRVKAIMETDAIIIISYKKDSRESNIAHFGLSSKDILEAGVSLMRIAAEKDPNLQVKISKKPIL